MDLEFQHLLLSPPSARRLHILPQQHTAFNCAKNICLQSKFKEQPQDGENPVPCLNAGSLRESPSIHIQQQTQDILKPRAKQEHPTRARCHCATRIHPISLHEIIILVQTSGPHEFSIPVQQQKQYRQQELKLNIS